MRISALTLVVLTLSTAGVAPAAAGGPQLAGRGARVVDGDTFWLGRVRVRLAGIEAPARNTAEGRNSRRYLSELVAGQVLTCNDTGGRTYGRVAAICYDQQGRDLGRLMIHAGWAWDWRQHSGGRYFPAELSARLGRRGVFADNPLRPRPVPESRLRASRAG